MSPGWAIIHCITQTFFLIILLGYTGALNGVDGAMVHLLEDAIVHIFLLMDHTYVDTNSEVTLKLSTKQRQLRKATRSYCFPSHISRASYVNGMSTTLLGITSISIEFSDENPQPQTLWVDKTEFRV
jgi:hypothetical protein